MMGTSITIKWEGLDQAISRLADIGEKIPQNIGSQMKELGGDTQTYWRQNTPRRSGKLEEGDNVEPDGMSFTLKNSIFYYPFVDTGHDTPRGWRTKRGYRLAKRRSHVAGREMTSKTMRFVMENINRYLSKSFDNV